MIVVITSTLVPHEIAVYHLAMTHNEGSHGLALCCREHDGCYVDLAAAPAAHGHLGLYVRSE